MSKKELLEMIETESNTEKIYDMLTNATKAELRDIAFECICCIKLGLTDLEEVQAGMIEDVTNNLEKVQWKGRM